MNGTNGTTKRTRTHTPADPHALAAELLDKVEALQGLPDQGPRRYLVGLAGIPGSGKVNDALHFDVAECAPGADSHPDDGARSPLSRVLCSTP